MLLLVFQRFRVDKFSADVGSRSDGAFVRHGVLWVDHVHTTLDNRIQSTIWYSYTGRAGVHTHSILLHKLDRHSDELLALGGGSTTACSS